LPNPLEDSRSRRLFAGFIVRTSLGLFFYPLRKKRQRNFLPKPFYIVIPDKSWKKPTGLF